MSVSLTKEQLALFDRLGRTPDGAMLLQVLKAWQTDVDQRLRRSTGEDLLRAQGDAQRLETLADLLTGAATRRLNELSKPARPVRFGDFPVT